ncbi:hypothetical protein HGA34_03825 [Candidatus Falkowbacteria bacterium]|nr:hypothetical protein [Candidatus Falkowbacteria bacterium]
MRFLLGPAPMWLFFILEITALLVAAYYYIKKRENAKAVFRRLLLVVLALKLSKPIFFTWTQWYVWHLSRPEFITVPLSADLRLLGWLKLFSFLKSVPGGYFVFYSFGRFWLGVLIALAVATLWWLVLKLLAKQRPGAMLAEELSLAWITAVIAGWPGIILYVPMALVFTAAGTLYFMAKKIDSRLPVGWPMIAASIIVALAGTFLVGIFGLVGLSV